MSRDLSLCESYTRGAVTQLQEDLAAAGLPMDPIQTIRTFAEQEALWAKGRTAPGEPCRHPGDTKPRAIGMCPVHPLGLMVTNARGGQSPHNWGCAVDLWFVSNGTVTATPPTKDGWDRFGAIAKKNGLTWGGLFRIHDLDHVENPRWKDIATSFRWQEQKSAAA